MVKRVSTVRRPAAEMSPELVEQRRVEKERGENIQAERERLFAAGVGGTPEAVAAPKPKEETVPTFIREDVDEIDCEIAGRQFTIGPPLGKSINVLMLQMFGGQEFSSAEARLSRVAFHVKSVDGKAVTLPRDTIERDMLITNIGDLAVLGIEIIVNSTWPTLRASELRIVKKKSRAG